MKPRMAKMARRLNCIFCDSTSHIFENCTHGFNGTREKLESCMLSDEKPAFNSYTKKKLKYMAYKISTKNGCVENELYNNMGIRLSQSKGKLVKGLEERWEVLQVAKKEVKEIPCRSNCHVCKGRVETYKYIKGEWVRSESELMYEKKMTTNCGHTFCVPCWSKQPMWIDSERPLVYGSRIRSRSYSVNCPYCSKLNYVTKDGVVSNEPVYSKEEIPGVIFR